MATRRQGGAAVNRAAFAGRLRKWLEDNNMSQAELAERMKASNSMLSEWLAQKTTPRVEMIPPLAIATGISWQAWMALLYDKSAREEAVSREEVARLQTEVENLMRRLA
jgi:transcriptional regulator with XRE-family HTH domain